MMDSVEEVKKKIDIVEFISSYITLKKTGRNFKSPCPFHQEKTPSFVVSPERQIWHCFGSCNEGGDIIKYLMKWENITFYEALKELAERAGIKLANVSFEDNAWKKKERIINMNMLASDFFHYVLTKTDQGKHAMEYILGREINHGIIEKFKLGYAPSSWDSLLKFMKKKKYENHELYEAGLITRSQKGGYFDMFRGRIIFPIKDARGNVIAFSGRILDEGEKSSKYVNTPETPIYHKRETLYGIDLAKNAIKNEKNAILVEGEFDVIAPYQHGIENVIATKGTAVTREQLMLLKRYTDRIILALDSDTAGEEAIRKAIVAAEGVDCEIEVVTFDFAKDPDEAVRRDLVKFKKTLKKTTPAYDFMLEILIKKYPESTPFDKKKIGDEMVPYIEKISNPIVQSHYVKKLAAFLDVSEGSIDLMIRRMRHQAKQKIFKVASVSKEEHTREVTLQKYILSVIFQSKRPYETADKIFAIITSDDFSIPAFKKLSETLFEFQKKSKEFNLQTFYTFLSTELHSVLDELYLFASLDVGYEGKDLEKLALEIKKYSLKKDITEMLGKDQDSPRGKLQDLSVSLKDVEKRLASL